MVIITPSFGKYFWMALPGFRRRRLFPVVVRGGGIMVMVFVICYWCSRVVDEGVNLGFPSDY